MPSTAHPNTIGLLLAAGRGARFDLSGRRSKLLEPITQNGLTQHCIGWSLDALAAAATTVVCALPSFASASALGSAQGYAAQHGAMLRSLLSKKSVQSIDVPRAHVGMGESLAFAAAHILRSTSHATATSLTVHLADMPWVTAEEIIRLVKAHHLQPDHENLISVPVVNGVRGNPIVFGRRHWASLMACSGDQGARGLIKRCEAQGLINAVVMDSDHALRDFDDPNSFK